MLSKLKAASVDTLVDVRAVASSRRVGFSKNMLAASLEAAGVAYVQLRALGTPKSGRDAARAGRIGEMRAIYEEHMRTPEAQDAYARLDEIARSRRAALLCFEADAAGCHRSILSARLAGASGAEIVDL